MALTGNTGATDAGCIHPVSPSGVKGAADTDNYACSSGIRIGNDPLLIMSSISTDNPTYESSLTSCTIVKSGTQETIYKHSPCPKSSTFLKLAARTTYQACVHTAVAVAKISVGFTWHVNSPGKTRRSLDDGKPLSEMFTIVGNSTADNAFRIVIGSDMGEATVLE
ncbi:hypothetical protein EG328_010740 [Venturia inaequalis]|uniref:Uncharacterized protein n=1 Tax=Venturia inaequalis TaxID=5025 RepID=A0A8H3V912_VENIN|nr:hypothetical protein EG328_010740 [Venturia inaequalis]RDI85856.1 hypothetical protein Vi05172_g4209 [Venturia inaequalis]